MLVFLLPFYSVFFCEASSNQEEKSRLGVCKHAIRRCEEFCELLREPGFLVVLD